MLLDVVDSQKTLTCTFLDTTMAASSQTLLYYSHTKVMKTFKVRKQWGSIRILIHSLAWPFDLSWVSFMLINYRNGKWSANWLPCICHTPHSWISCSPLKINRIFQLDIRHHIYAAFTALLLLLLVKMMETISWRFNQL